MNAALWFLLGMITGHCASYLDRRWRKWRKIGEFKEGDAS